MRRRSILVTLAGAGVGLCVPFAKQSWAGNGLPAASLSLPQRMRALQIQMNDLSRRTTGRLQETADEIAGLCDVVLRRFEKNGAGSPAILQRCADMLNELRTQRSGLQINATSSELIAAHRDALLDLIGSTDV